MFVYSPVTFLKMTTCEAQGQEKRDKKSHFS